MNVARLPVQNIQNLLVVIISSKLGYFVQEGEQNRIEL